MSQHILKIAAVSSLFILPLHGQSWTASGSGVWSSTNNWVAPTNSGLPIPPNSPSSNADITTPNASVAVDANYTVGELTIGATDKVTINDGQSLTVTSSAGFTGAGTINNAGTINVNSTGDATALNIGGNVTLSGGGTINLNGGVLTGQYTYPSTGSLTNVDNTIQGGGSLLGQQFNSGSLGTLNNEGTINASVPGGYLALPAQSLQNSGTLEASNGGMLLLGGYNGSAQITGGGTITAQTNSTVSFGQNSSANLTGAAISAQNGGTVILGDNTTLNGGSLSTTGTGKIETPVNTNSQFPTYSNVNLNNVTNTGNYLATDNSSTILNGTLVNSGTMTFTSTTGPVTLGINGSVTLSGGGTITLNNATLGGANFVFPNPNNLTNVDNTIQGGGSLQSQQSASALNSLTNGGTIDATGTGLYLATAAGTIQNTGTLEASNGGTLLLGGVNGSTSLMSTGGAITAQANSTVSLGQNSSANLTNTAISAQNGGTVILGDNTTINGGSLSTTGTGKIETPANTNPQFPAYSTINLNSVTNSGNYLATDNSQTILSGTLVNSGTMTFTSTTGSVTLGINGSATLSGGGTITLNNATLGGANFVFPNPNNLTNVDNTIQGGGTILSQQFGGGSLATLVNETQGTIDANVAGQTLLLSPNMMQNTGTIEATNFGTLQLGGQYGSTSLTSTAGTIKAGEGSNVQLGQSSMISGTSILAYDGGSVSLGQNAAINGGFLGTIGTGKIVAVASSNVALTGVTNAGNYVANDGSTTTLGGTINNTGNMTFNSTGGVTTLAISGNVTLSGGGTVTMKNGSALAGSFSGQNSPSLTNVDNLIQGGSTTSVNSFAPQISSLTNEAAGTINANAAGGTFLVNANNVQNSGTMEATNFSTLHVAGSMTNLSGGLITATAGAEVLVSQGVGTNAGVISITGGTFDNGGNFLNNTGQIVGNGTLNTGGLTNNGTITLAGGASTVNGNVTNAAGQTISVLQDQAIFTGDVVNNGTFRSTNAAATFKGTFTNNGAFVTDPSTTTFGNLNIGANGSIVAGAGDTLIVTGNITDDSTSTQTNIAAATLTFSGAGTHTITTSSSAVPLTVNTLDVGAGVMLTFDLGAGNAFYITNLDLADGASQLADLTLNSGTLYYDPNAAGNAYLDGATFNLAGGGTLVAGVAPTPTPEPSTWAMLLAGVSGLLFLRRVRQKI